MLKRPDDQGLKVRQQGFSRARASFSRISHKHPLPKRFPEKQRLSRKPSQPLNPQRNPIDAAGLGANSGFSGQGFQG